jgi:hypothetical protein
MNFYVKQHRYYCGVDLHARSMYVVIIDSGGNVLKERNPHRPGRLPCPGG